MKRKHLTWMVPLCVAIALMAQQINPNQIQPSTTNGQFLATVGGVTQWVNGGGGGGGGSPKVIYASHITGVTSGVAVAAGSSATGTTDSAAAINGAISGGNIDLEVDSGFALSTSLVLYSNTTIHCTSPQYGFIMQAASNVPVFVNAHQNAPTTASGTGGYLVSNQTDNNIQVIGCMVNANSTQAVTGSGNCCSTPHTTNPSTGVVVFGALFTGVNGMTFNNNEVYDPGTYMLAGANDTNVIWNNNYFHVPQPTVNFKNTNGPYLLGPDNNVEINGNFINSGDDAIALAAEDCNRPSVAYCMISGWLWGPIQHAHIEHNILINASNGVRLLDATELLDDIDIGDTQGVTTGIALTLAQFPSLDTYGGGNMGRINIHGWKVQTTGTYTGAGTQGVMVLGLNTQDLEISDVQYVNPAVNWPLLYDNPSEGTIKTLNLYGWDITTTSSTFSSVVSLNGPVTYAKASNITWNDTVGTGFFFAGATSPTNFACSNYVGRGLYSSALIWPSGAMTGDCYVQPGAPTSSIPAAAAGANGISANGTANQVWGMNSGGTAQGWQTPSGSSPIANITISVSSGAESANTCSSATPVTMTGVTTSGAGSNVTAGYTNDPSTLTGWGSSGGMVFQVWPSAANQVSWRVCNQTTVSINYSAVTLSIGAK